MAKIGAIFGSLRAVALLILRALVRVAERWAAPGAGPRLVSG
jgi:hypothetical protein